MNEKWIVSLKTKLYPLKKQLKKKTALLLFQPQRKENSRKLEALRDIHKGKRCFIVCNGPSLKAEDLNKIQKSGDISFGCNKIDKIFPNTSWRPTYYCVTDEGYQYSLLDEMQRIPSKVHFYREESYSTTRKVQHNCIWLNVNGDRNLLDNPRFYEDIRDEVAGIASVTYVIMQVVVYMGMRELYLIGCDCSYAVEITKDGQIINNGGSSYFAGSDAADMKHSNSTWEMLTAFEFARKYADEHDIKIYNATRGGKLEAFERVDFDTLF